MSDYSGLIPADDSQRLEALRSYNLLGTEPDVVFDEIVRLTARLFDVPIALVSLVDEGNVEFKANYGLAGISKVDRSESICSVAVLSNETTVFEDLHANPCLLINQAAAQQFNFGFYAGHALQTAEGHNIGSLCIIDRKPRAVSGPERERLADLAELVVQLFDLKNALRREPGTAAALWLQIYRSIDESLMRLGTLRELAQWEESAATDAAQRYQQSIEEEAGLITQVLGTQIAAAMKRVQ